MKFINVLCTAMAVVVFLIQGVGCAGKQFDRKPFELAGTTRHPDFDSPLLSKIRLPDQITSSTHSDYSARWLPDGSAIIFVSDRRGNADLYLKFLPGSGQVGEYPLTFHTTRDVDPAVSPRGTEVAFVSYRSDSRGDLYLSNLRKQGRIPQAIRDRFFQRFGAALSRGGESSEGMKRVESYLDRTSEITQLTEGAPADSQPAWSSAGDAIFFTRTERGPERIYRMDVDSRGVTAVTEDHTSMPAPSPDGEHLAYVLSVPSRGARNASGFGSLWIQNLRTGEKRAVTAGPKDAFPRWDETGKNLYFVRYVDDTNNDRRVDLNDFPSIYTVGVHDSSQLKPRRLTAGNRYDLYPDVQRGKILMTSTVGRRDSTTNIFAMNAEGFFPYATPAEFLEASAELRKEHPRLAALALEETERKWANSEYATRADLERGRILSDLGQGDAAHELWKRAAAGQVPEVSLLARLEIAKAQMQKGLASTGSPRLQVQEFETKALTISKEAARFQLANVSARCLWEQAQAWFLVKDEAKAIAALDRLTEQHRTESDLAAQALLQKTDVYVKFGDTGRILRGYFEVIDRYPDVIPWSETAADKILRIKIKGLKNRKDIDAAIKELISTYERKRVFPAFAMNALGKRAAEAQDAKSAEQIFRSVIRDFHDKEPRQVAHAQFGLATVLLQKGNYEEATELFQKGSSVVSTRDPSAKLARKRLVDSLLAKGRDELFGSDPKAAIKTFRNLIEFDYEIVQAHRGMIAAYAANNEADDAVSIYKTEIRNRPGHYLPVYGLGLAKTYEEPVARSLKDAEPLLLEAISLNGRAVFPHQTLGFVYEKREELFKEQDLFERALDEYLIALSLSDPTADYQNYADLLLNIGNGYFLIQDYANAYDYYRKRKETDAVFLPKEQKLVFLERFARSAYHMDRYEEAVQYADQALALLAELAPSKTMTDRELLSHETEIKDVQALCLQEDQRHGKAAEKFAEVATLNLKRGDPQNQAKALRNLAINLFEGSKTKVDERALADARDHLEEGLALVTEHGARTTPKKETDALLDIGMEVGMSNDTSAAAKGFDAKAERDLMYAFAYRIDRDRGRPQNALESLESKLKLSPAPDSVDPKNKPAVHLKRSILLNQIGSQHFALGDYETAAAKFRESYEHAEVIGHRQGLWLNTEALLLLSEIRPQIVPFDEVKKRMEAIRNDPTFLIAPEYRITRAAFLMSELRLLERELSREADPSSWSDARFPRLNEILKDVRFTAKQLADAIDSASPSEEVKLAYTLELHHVRWTGHRFVRSTDSAEEAIFREAGQKGFHGLAAFALAGRAQVLLSDGDAMAPEQLGRLVSYLSQYPAADFSDALVELDRFFARWEEAAVSKEDPENFYRASEWRSRIRFQIALVSEPALRSTALFHQPLEIPEPSDLMAMMGPRRVFIKRLEGTPQRFFTLKEGEIALSDKNPLSSLSPGEEVYVSGLACPPSTSCSHVQSAGHLFYALSSQSIFQKRALVRHEGQNNASVKMEHIPFGTRSDVHRLSGLADVFVSDRPLQSNPGRPLAAFIEIADFNDVSSFDRVLPARILPDMKVHTVVVASGENERNPPSLDVCEFFARGGIATLAVASKAPFLWDEKTRIGDVAVGGNWFICGALGYSAEERPLLAEIARDEAIAKAADLYRQEKWAESLRYFEQGLGLIRESDDEFLLDQALDAASTAAYRADDYSRAIRLAEELVALRKKLEHPELGNSIQFLGVLYSRVERFDDAVARLHEAAKFFEVHQAEPQKISESASTLGVVLENSRDYEAALRAFDQSLDILKSSGAAKTAPAKLGEQWRRIGRIHYLRLNRYSAATKAFETARRLFEAAGDVRQADESELELGLVEEQRASFTSARARHLKVFDRATQRSDAAQAAKAALYIANTYWYQGDYFEAFTWQRKAMDLAKKAQDRRLQLLCHSTAGLIYWTLNDIERALEEQTRALEISNEISSALDEASAYNNMGLVFREKGELDRSIELFHQALEVDRGLKSQWGQAYDLRNLGISHTLKNEPEIAEKHLRESIRISKAIGNQVNETKALLNLAELLLRREKWDEAAKTFHESLTLSRTQGLKEVEWRSLFGLGQVTHKRGNRPGAVLYLKEAVERVEAQSAAIKIEEFRNGFIANKLGLYENLVLLLLEDKNRSSIVEAWSYAERARSRSFIDLLGNRNLASKTPGEEKLLSADRKSRETIDTLEQELAGAKSKESAAEINLKLKNARREREELLIEIRARNPQLSSFLSVNIIELPDLQKILGSDTALVEYFLTKDKILVWVITGDDIRLLEKSANRKSLEGKISRFTTLTQKQLPLLKEAQELYALLWSGVEEVLEGKRFVGLVPHRSLHYLSFASLFDGRRFLLERRPLFYTPSASVLSFTAHAGDQRKEGVRVLAIGNPDLNNPAFDLPFAEREVSAMALSLPRVDILTRERATESWVKENISKYEIIHFASHGEFDSINPLFSAIKLAPTKGSSGDLRAEEVFQLKLNADLVTLSACQTGIAKLAGGDELIGLNRSFLYAGTHAILSSLWRISDVATAVTVKHFYRNYGSATKAESLQRAQLHVKDYFPHPSYWASLYLTGNWK